MFENAKIGDKFWSLKYGECVIVGIHPNLFYPVSARASCAIHCWHINGNLSSSDITKDAYWYKPKIIEKPRKETKTSVCIVGYVNIYKHCIYDTFEKAKAARHKNAIGEPIYLKHTWQQ